MTDTRIPRCGDRMKRVGPNARPNDDGYELAYWDPEGDSCSMTGWPESYDRKRDFVLVEACSDQEHYEAVRRWAESDGRQDSGGSDHRQRRVLDLYGHILRPISQNQSFEVVLVREFHLAFNCEAPERPQRLFSREESWHRFRFTDEEARELIHALTAKPRDLVAVVDAMCDLAYYCAGTLVCLGVAGKGENEAFGNHLDGGFDSLMLVESVAGLARRLSLAFAAKDPRALRDSNQDALKALAALAPGREIWRRCFHAVHAANMRKLWPDGKPRRNEHGKIIKPEGWCGPERELAAILGVKA